MSTTNAAKRQQLHNLQIENSGTKEQYDLAKKIVNNHHPTRKQLLVRELTCKVKERATSLLPCLHPDCPKLYRSEK